KGSCLSAYPWVHLLIEGGIAGEIMSQLRKNGQQVDNTRGMVLRVCPPPRGTSSDRRESAVLRRGPTRFAAAPDPHQGAAPGRKECLGAGARRAWVCRDAHPPSAEIHPA